MLSVEYIERILLPVRLLLVVVLAVGFTVAGVDVLRSQVVHLLTEAANKLAAA